MNKKRFYAVIMAAVLGTSMLAGCGNSSASSDTASTEASSEETTEEETTYPAEAYLSGITASDYVTLPDYATVPVEIDESAYEISDEDVQSEIDQDLENTAVLVEITDRDTVEEGDVVNIDYVGKKDGEAFDGGTASGSDLEIGSGRFIDGFEDGIIGMKTGESKTLELTFPENYYSEDLAGQAVTFDVTVNKIQESQVPEFTDEWVADRSIDDVSTTEEYTAYIRDQLEDAAQSTREDDIQNYAVQYLTENATWAQDPPTAMTDRIYDVAISNYQAWADSYGVELDDFLSATGYDPETFYSQLREMADQEARQYICLQALADAEDLNLTDAEYKTQVAVQAASYGYTDADSFEEAAGEDNIRQYLTSMRAEEFLVNNTVVTDAAESQTDTAAEAATEAAEADTEAAE